MLAEQLRSTYIHVFWNDILDSHLCVCVCAYCACALVLRNKLKLYHNILCFQCFGKDSSARDAETDGFQVT